MSANINNFITIVNTAMESSAEIRPHDAKLIMKILGVLVPKLEKELDVGRNDELITFFNAFKEYVLDVGATAVVSVPGYYASDSDLAETSTVPTTNLTVGESTRTDSLATAIGWEKTLNTALLGRILQMTTFIRNVEEMLKSKSTAYTPGTNHPIDFMKANFIETLPDVKFIFTVDTELKKVLNTETGTFIKIEGGNTPIQSSLYMTKFEYTRKKVISILVENYTGLVTTDNTDPLGIAALAGNKINIISMAGLQELSKKLVAVGILTTEVSVLNPAADIKALGDGTTPSSSVVTSLIVSEGGTTDDLRIAYIKKEINRVVEAITHHLINTYKFPAA